MLAGTKFCVFGSVGRNIKCQYSQKNSHLKICTYVWSLWKCYSIPSTYEYIIQHPIHLLKHMISRGTTTSGMRFTPRTLSPVRMDHWYRGHHAPGSNQTWSGSSVCEPSWAQTGMIITKTRGRLYTQESRYVHQLVLKRKLVCCWFREYTTHACTTIIHVHVDKCSFNINIILTTSVAFQRL